MMENFLTFASTVYHKFMRLHKFSKNPEGAIRKEARLSMPRIVVTVTSGLFHLFTLNLLII